MKNGFWSNMRRFAALGCVAVTAAGAVYAQDPLPQVPASDPIAELKARLDRLEQENKELRQIVREGNPVNFQPPSADKKDVEKIVADYIKADEKKKKDAEDKKKKEEADKGFEVGKDFSMTASWRNGLELSTKDKAFKVHVGGRFQYDNAWFTNDSGGFSAAPTTAFPSRRSIFEDGSDLRRARLRVDGTIWEVIDFVAEFDFTNTQDLRQAPSLLDPQGTVNPTDVFVNIGKLPYIGNLRVGHFKEPFGFEHNTSSRFLNFMERSMAFDAFVADFNYSDGMMIFNNACDENVYWAVGVFREGTNAFGTNAGDGEYALTGKVSTLPWFEQDGRYLWHIGASGRHANPHRDRIRLRSRAPIRDAQGFQTPNIVDTRDFFADSETLVGLETALQYGPFMLISEYYGFLAGDSARVDNPPLTGPLARGDRYFQGGYVELLCFLTGEHKSYNRRSGNFDRVIPHENFFCVESEDCGTCRGWGAWQVGVRYTHLDLDDTQLPTAATAVLGRTDDVTLGLNWFLNPNTKIQFNYFWLRRNARESVIAGREAPTLDGTANGFGVRVAIDF